MTRHISPSNAAIQTAVASRRRFLQATATAGASLLAGNLLADERPKTDKPWADQSLYVYTLTQDSGCESYDEAIAATCLQGLINRDSPSVYLLSKQNLRPQYWLSTLSKEGRWLEGRKTVPLADLDALARLAGSRLAGAVIWDPDVPATVNVATTVAGVRNGIVLSPEYAERYRRRWNLPVLLDLRGRFTGAETGSKKNDAYRWAIREYLQKGLCSSQLLCLYEDAYFTRERGAVGYAVTRDWAVRRRAFVFDLSPWGDETPGDDARQTLGLDLETYRMILAETLRQSGGKHMTELAGFFSFSKYSATPDHKSEHNPVATEWETVRLISPYNCYQNTVADNCFNQSLHAQMPRKPLKQRRAASPIALENKTYLCFFMADYDSATPLYDILPNQWGDANRGKLPLAWGVNPNLIDTYPDIFSYFYETATAADTFTSDASAAGYMNPNRIAEQYLPLFVAHNRRFFQEADMTIAPMVLDRDQPSDKVKDAFAQFAPDGFATIVHPTGYGPAADPKAVVGRAPSPHVWKGMPVTNLVEGTGGPVPPPQLAERLRQIVANSVPTSPDFQIIRVVWTSPTVVSDAVSLLRRARPDLQLEVVGPDAFFALLKQQLEKPAKP